MERIPARISMAYVSGGGGRYPAWAGGLWLCRILVPSGLRAVVVPSGLRVTVQPNAAYLRAR